MNNKINKFQSMIITSILILIAICAIRLYRPNTMIEIPIQTIQVAGVKSLGQTPLVIADKLGYFEQNGVKLEITWMPGGDQVFKALTSKSTDIGFVGLVPYGFVGRDFPSIKLVTVITELNDTKLITNKEKISSLADLKSKKIGYTKTTASDIHIHTLLAKNGIDLSTIQLINLSPAALPTALYKGEIDAYSAREPNIYNGQKLLGKDKSVIFDHNDQKYERYFSLFADQTYIDAHPLNIQGVQVSLKMAQDYIAKHSSESQSIMEDFMGMETGTLASIRSDYTFATGIQPKHRDALIQIFDWATQQKGGTATTINPNDFIAQ